MKNAHPFAKRAMVLLFLLGGCGEGSDPFGPYRPKQEVPLPPPKPEVNEPAIVNEPEPRPPSVKPEPEKIEPKIVIVPIPIPVEVKPEVKAKVKLTKPKVRKPLKITPKVTVKRKPTESECSQIGMGINIVGRDRVIAEGMARGHSRHTVEEVLKACGY